MSSFRFSNYILLHRFVYSFTRKLYTLHVLKFLFSYSIISKIPCCWSLLVGNFLFHSVALSLFRSFTLRSLALSLFALSLFSSSLFRSFTLRSFALSLFHSFALSLFALSLFHSFLFCSFTLCSFALSLFALRSFALSLLSLCPTLLTLFFSIYTIPYMYSVQYLTTYSMFPPLNLNIMPLYNLFGMSSL